jgi:uncharacterized protein YbjT (DUF2867 family)
MSRLKNKVAVVTDGTSGIGLATVKRFVADGAFVYVFARRNEELDRVAASLSPNIATVSDDARNLDDLDRLYARIACWSTAACVPSDSDQRSHAVRSNRPAHCSPDKAGCFHLVRGDFNAKAQRKSCRHNWWQQRTGPCHRQALR